MSKSSKTNTIKSLDFEGQIELDLQTICSKQQNGTIERTYALKPKKGSQENVTGTITLSMGFSTESQDLNEKPKKKSRTTSKPSTGDKKTAKTEKEAGPRKHFGLPLKNSLENAKQDNILHVIKKCVNYLMKHGKIPRQDLLSIVYGVLNTGLHSYRRRYHPQDG